MKFQSKYATYRIPNHEQVVKRMDSLHSGTAVGPADFLPWFRNLHTAVFELLLYGDAEDHDADPILLLFRSLGAHRMRVSANAPGSRSPFADRNRALNGATHLSQPWLFHRILELLAVWNGPEGFHLNMSKLAPAYFDLLYLLAAYLEASDMDKYYLIEKGKATPSLIPDGVPLV